MSVKRCQYHKVLYKSPDCHSDVFMVQAISLNFFKHKSCWCFNIFSLQFFDWINWIKKLTLKDTVSYCFLSSFKKVFWGPYFPLGTACLFSYGKNKQFCVCIITSKWVCISSLKPHSAPLIHFTDKNSTFASQSGGAAGVPLPRLVGWYVLTYHYIFRATIPDRIPLNRQLRWIQRVLLGL